MRTTARTRQTERHFDHVEYGKMFSSYLTKSSLTYRSAAPLLGVSHSTLQRIATGKSPPDVETYLRINQWISTKIEMEDSSFPGERERDLGGSTAYPMP
jgi:transcriptional regulator with XRE-family HTH domain